MTTTSYDVLLAEIQKLGPTLNLLTPEALAARLRNAIAAWDAARLTGTDTDVQWGVQYDWTDSYGVTHTDTDEHDYLSDALDAIGTMRPKGATSHRLVRRTVSAWEITPPPSSWAAARITSTTSPPT